MKNSAFRFLHAGDFRLGHVATGLPYVPEFLRDTLLDAAWQSAAAVFDRAIEQQVDFVLLNGRMTTAEHAVRSALFLNEQFDRLSQHSIPVLWHLPHGGSEDLQQFRWPTGVRLLTDGATRTVHRHQTLLASISAGLPPAVSSADVFQITFSEKPSDTADYVAASGPGRFEHLRRERTVVHAPGSPQGAGFHEAGAHGCSLIEVGTDGRVHTSLLEVNHLEWRTERVTITAPTSSAALERLITDRCRSLSVPGVTRIVSWTLDGDAAVIHEQLRPTALRALLRSLHESAITTTSSVWSAALDCADSLRVAEQRDTGNTCLNDFLRLARDRMAPNGGTASGLTHGVVRDAELMRHVARLGVELLS